MNSVIEAINSRRSVRCYKTKPVPKEILEQIVDAGNNAPFTSMTRSQPWRFVVVQDPKFREKLLQAAFPFWKGSIDSMKDKAPELYDMAMTMYNAYESKDVIYYSAPAIIFVIGPAGSGVSCALACENMMIAAQSFGLGSCYVGFGAMVKGSPEVVEALELQEGEAIFGPILLGYPELNPSEAITNALQNVGPNKKDSVTKWI
ncbi:MAG: nitroreductase family protein [Candidatus Bathyarchaeota archaeon]|nr:nitroreductase family protein [Candidatus Bathyarchaeota archaeon]